jgi:hypothetical protein
MDVQSKIAGLIEWKDHTPRAGESYCLKHLHPIDFIHEMPASGRHPAVTVRVHVAFGLHTFTRGIKTDDPPEDDYEDNREKRCFDYDRYNHSHRLPAIVREIPTCRKLYFSRTRSGLINYATFDTGGGKTYAVFFDVMRYKTRGPNTVLLTVESAYELHEAKRDTREGRVNFNVLVGHALRDTKPNPPPRAR